MPYKLKTYKTTHKIRIFFHRIPNHTDLILFGRVAGFRDSELMNGRYIPLGGKTCPQLVCSHTQSCFRASEKHPKLKNTYRLRISQ